MRSRARKARRISGGELLHVRDAVLEQIPHALGVSLEELERIAGLDVGGEDEDRDARNWMVGLTHVFRFAQDKHYIRVGYQFDYEKADGRNYTYAGNRFLAGGQYTLPWGSTRLKYDFDLHQRHYLHANTLLPVVNPGTREREDSEQNHVVRVEQVLAAMRNTPASGTSWVAHDPSPPFDFAPERNAALHAKAKFLRPIKNRFRARLDSDLIEPRVARFGERLHETIVNRSLDEDAAPRAAILPGVAERRRDCRGHARSD